MDSVISLGFGVMELNFTLNTEQVKSIISGACEHGIAISSLHNYVPEPPAGERFYMLSDIDQSPRLTAIELTKNTIRLAADLGASAVVLHMGQPRNIDLNIPQNELRQAIHHNTSPAEIALLRDNIIRERKALSSAYLDSMLFSLDDLAPTAERLGIMLGIESRYYYGQFPDFEELGILLQEFTGSNIGYWHDCGHTRHTEFCGLGKTSDYLNAFGNRLVGVHLHDTALWTDHQIPYPGGDIDFKQLKPYIKNDTILVLELLRGCDLISIQSGLDYLRESGIE